jgi:hypothetical protein
VEYVVYVQYIDNAIAVRRRSLASLFRRDR